MIFTTENRKEMLLEAENYLNSVRVRYQSLKEDLSKIFLGSEIVSLNGINKEDVLNSIYNFSDPYYFKYEDTSNLEKLSKEELIYNFRDILKNKFTTSEIYTASTLALEERERAETKSIVVHLSNKEEFTKQRLQETLKFVKDMKTKGISVQIKILADNERKDEQAKVAYYFNKKEMAGLGHFEKKLNSLGMPNLIFCDKTPYVNGNENWTLTQVLNANNKLDSFVKEIKKLKLTPFEAIMAIHKIASNFAFNKNEYESSEHAATLVGVLNGDRIICQGYATLVKALVDRLNMPGLTAELSGMQCKNEDGTMVFHANNIIHLQDNVYNISGIYMEDACWDARKDKNSARRGLVHCAYPIQDMFKYNKLKDVKPIEMTASVTSSLDEEGGVHYNVVYKELPAQESVPISYDTYKKAYASLLKKQGRDNDTVSEMVSKEMKETKRRVTIRFSNADSAFYKEAIKQTDMEQ